MQRWNKQGQINNAKIQCQNIDSILSNKQCVNKNYVKLTMFVNNVKT